MVSASLLLCLAGAWAESPSLASKATDPSLAAVLTYPEILSRPWGEISPRAVERSPAMPGEWRWMGRRLEVLEPSRDSSIELGFGNEVGDPLFRESQLDEHDVDNRNPAMWAHLPTPRLGGIRLAADFDQVDHFSDRSLGVRADRLGNPALTGKGPSVRRAWFGENLPNASLAGVRARYDGRGVQGDFAAHAGWLWLTAPLSLELQAWEVRRLQGHAEGRRWVVRLAQVRFDRADDREGRLEQSRGEAELRLADSALKVGVRAAWDRSRGEAWRAERPVRIEPWAAHRLVTGSVFWSGFHLAGRDGFQAADTLGWMRRRNGDSLGLSLAVGLSDRPDGSATGRDSSQVGLALDAAGGIEQSYALRFGASRRLGRGAMALELQPWVLVHPHAFCPKGFEGSGGWTRRSGRTVSLPGWLGGASARLRVRQNLSSHVALDGILQCDPVTGSVADRVDLTPPLWGAGGGAVLRHPSGLELEARWLWRSEAVLRHRTPQDWTVPAGPEASLWLRQAFLGDRLALECAALNVLSDDRVTVPDGSEDRFRLLVRIRARLW